MADNKKIIEDLEEIKRMLGTEIPLKQFIQSGVYEYINNMIKDIKDKATTDFSTIGEKIRSFTKDITKPEKIDYINSLHKRFFSNDLRDQSEQDYINKEYDPNSCVSNLFGGSHNYCKEPQVEREPECKQPRSKRWYYLETCDDQIKDVFAEDASFIPVIIKNVIETTDNFQGILAITITPDPTNLERYYVKIILRREQ